MVKFIKGVNDLESQRPNLIKEWDYEKNELNPAKLIVGSGKKVWWKCPEGHSWQAEIYRRSAGSGCPFCAGQRAIEGVNDLATTYPLLALEWNYEKNGELTPQNVMGQSGKKVWWRCAFGHEWAVSPNSRVSNNSGCPICSSEYKTSFPEQAFLFYIRQVAHAENRYILEGIEFDIFLPDYNVAIEYDGIYFHDSENIIKKEKEKEIYCLNNSIKLLRIKEYRTGKEKSIIRKSEAYKTFLLDIKKQEKLLEGVIADVLIWLKEECVIKRNVDVNILRDKEKIWAQYILGKKEKSLQECYPIIALEWNQNRNGKLQPNQIMPNTHKKVWWKCHRGHEWESTPSHRIEGNGCPYCAHQKYLKGFNDLVTLYPDIAREWNYDKNETQPEDVLGGGQKKYWWICSKGHEWQASVCKRANGRKCPICAGKKVIKGINDFGTYNPLISKEWDYSKNEVNPEEVTKYSNKKVWWICSKCNNEWQMTVNARSSGRGCPECAKKKRIETRIKNSINKKGSFLEVYPEIAKEWNVVKNGSLLPQNCTPKSNKKVWWKCRNNHEWQATINNRTSGQGCPICARKRKNIK